MCESVVRRFSLDKSVAGVRGGGVLFLRVFARCLMAGNLRWVLSGTYSVLSVIFATNLRARCGNGTQVSVFR